MTKLKTYVFDGDGDPKKTGKPTSSEHGFPTRGAPADGQPPELISSELDDIWGEHVLALDIDLPCHLIETSPGRHHLVVEKRMGWESLEKLLRALAEAGIVEYGFAGASIARQATFLRIHPATPREVDV